jgi:hypothetical protein
MLAILGLIFPVIKSFLGENLIEKMLAHKQALAASANERERVNIDADVSWSGARPSATCRSGNTSIPSCGGRNSC